MLVEDQDLQAQAAKIEAVLEAIESFPDPAMRENVAEIVQGLLAFHGEGLARMLQIIAQQDDPAAGQRTLAAFTEDGVISHMLLLHDLHPVDVTTRVEQALEGVRPYLQSHGGNVALIAVEDGVAHLRLEGHCKGCPSSTMTLKLTVEEAIRKAAPELIGIDAEDGMEAPPPANFVPISALFVQKK